MAALSRDIAAAIRKLPAPDFVRVDHPSAHRWVLVVPVYTDVEDPAFVDRVRAAIERAWQVRDGGDEFSVRLEVHRVSPGELYPDGGLPARGAHIDLAEHTRRFPPGGAVVTTGANVTQIRGRNIVLGAGDLVPGTLAHEFGHVLGFKDGYEVLEVIVAPDEVVAAPEGGRVRRQHFEDVLGGARR